jgi:hypothetical protein
MPVSDDHDDIRRRPDRDDRRSSVLPTDPYDIKLAELLGLTNSAHIEPVCVQHIDDYGNVTVFQIQTVRTDIGATVFMTIAKGSALLKYVLPPKVLRVLDRQRDSATVIVRRRHGRRLAEERQLGGLNPFTPEMRTKALETRKRKAAKRAARRTK